MKIFNKKVRLSVKCFNIAVVGIIGIFFYTQTPVQAEVYGTEDPIDSYDFGGKEIYVFEPSRIDDSESNQSEAPPSVSNITQFSARLNGNVISGEGVTRRGFEYGKTMLYGSSVYERGIGLKGPYSLLAMRLTCGTKYYFRSFATNAAGTARGREQSFTTANCADASPAPNATPTSGSSTGGSDSPADPGKAGNTGAVPAVPALSADFKITSAYPSGVPSNKATIVSVQGKGFSRPMLVNVAGLKITPLSVNSAGTHITFEMPGNVRAAKYKMSVSKLVENKLVFSNALEMTVYGSPSATASPSPTNSPTYSPTPSATVTSSPSPTVTASPTASPTYSPSPSSIPTPTYSPTPSATVTSSPTPTPTTSSTPAPSESPTPSILPSVSPSPSPTSSPSATTNGNSDMFASIWDALRSYFTDVR